MHVLRLGLGAWLGVLALLALAEPACQKVGLSAPPDAMITLNVAPTTIALAGGSASVVANVVQASGGPVEDGTTVFFFTTLGTIDESATTEGGFARVTLLSAGIQGKATVTAVSGNAAPAVADVQIGFAADRLSLTATPMAFPVGGGEVLITATVRDDSGTGIPGRVVIFSATSPGVLASGGAGVVTDASGQARDTLTTIAESTVTAGVVGSELSQSVTVSEEDASVAGLSLSASPGSLPTGGGSVSLTAVVFDSTGLPAGGVSVSFTASEGDVSPEVATTNASGEASATLVTTLTSRVTATSSGTGTTITVTVGTTGVSRILILNVSPVLVSDTTPPIDPCAVPSGNPQLPVTLLGIVTDSEGNLIDGQTIDLSIVDVVSDDFDALGGFCVGGSLALTASATSGSHGTGAFVIPFSFSDVEMLLCPPVPPESCTATIRGNSVETGATTTLLRIQ